MVTKNSILVLCLLFLTLSACYTITHPDPCPGLVELNSENDVEESVCLYK